MDLDSVNRDSTEWRPLSRLFGAYLNQDVLDDYGDIWPAVATFKEESTRTNVSASARAARRLSSEFDDDETTEQAADRLGLAYSPRADGWSCKEWLIALADFLEAA